MVQTVRTHRNVALPMVQTVRIHGNVALPTELLPGSDPSHSAAIGTIEEGVTVPIATRKPPTTRRPDDAQTIPASPREGLTSPREGMIGALSAGLVAAVASGDLDAARVANDAIGKLLGPASTPTSTPTGAVVELAAARRAGR
jgi:hypothetical protein